MTSARWRKSSFSSGSQNNCVEVSLAVEHARVRDSKNATGPILAVNAQTWQALLRWVE
ncbi:DUF397 domain-containing protein [Actinokineospora alba]|uniref:DUF397 domain-containing protein n=1 Tax=Actinokineospora alba TaxID=504798 RepID=UPI000B836D2A|nr:DUF397 domain-containing protein [Actinokineospora alba]TDP65644.1 uncharacterized protein DUF397 [Actinokineospora alba]